MSCKTRETVWKKGSDQKNIVKKALRTFLTAVYFSEASYACAQDPGGGYGMGPGMMGWGYGMGWFMSVIMVGSWIAVIAGVVLLVRWIVSVVEKYLGSQSQEAALDVLNNRYARGEITKEEYEKIKKDIS
jgi:putative membrane protein